MTQVCETCGLPEELCVCEDVAKDRQTINVYTEERSFGKTVTVAENFDQEDIDIDSLSSKLKSRFACGGTYEEDKIELQGDHKSGLIEELKDKGYEISD